MNSQVLTFLFAGYSLVWVLIFAYILFMGNRQKKLAEELETLRRVVEEKEQE